MTGRAPGPGSAAGPVAPAVPPPAPFRGRARSAAGGGSGSTGGSAVSPQTAAAAKGAVGGVSRAGVACTKGTHQVSWSTWTPYCQSRWSGNNGGATTYGVTASTITMTYRNSNTSEGAALQAIAGAGSADISEANYQHDLQVYINYFNTQFELYGRKVVLKAFDGQGDYLQEYQGQDIPGAQADAQKAHDLGAFGDMSFSEIVMTTPYAQALAANKVMSLSAAPASASTYRKMAPYGWNSLSMINLLGVWFGNLTCQRLAGMPAIFSPNQATKQRSFGLLQPDTPDFNEVGDITEGILNKCGVKLTKRIRYSPDLSKQSNDMSNAMVQLASSGTTSVLCLCDGTGNILATSAASSQQYYPEWITNGIADEDSQRFAKDQSPHAISPNGAAVRVRQGRGLAGLQARRPVERTQAAGDDPGLGLPQRPHDVRRPAGSRAEPEPVHLPERRMEPAAGAAVHPVGEGAVGRRAGAARLLVRQQHHQQVQRAGRRVPLLHRQRRRVPEGERPGCVRPEAHPAALLRALTRGMELGR